jgi:hypothetical protein
MYEQPVTPIATILSTLKVDDKVTVWLSSGCAIRGQVNDPWHEDVLSIYEQNVQKVEYTDILISAIVAVTVHADKKKGS